MLGSTFAYPWILWGLLSIPLLVFFYWRRRRRMITEMTFSSLQRFEKTRHSMRERLHDVPVALRLAALALFIGALARPQSATSVEKT